MLLKFPPLEGHFVRLEPFEPRLKENVRSQAAVLKLGGVKEETLRRDRLTWTGYIRDTVYFSILDTEWPAMKARLEERVAHWRQTSR